MKKLVIGAAGFVVVALGVYFLAANGDKDKASQAAPNNIKQIVQDFSSGHSKAKSASITSRELTVVNQDSTKTVFSLPDDEFFVSIAPYVNQTHPCAIHNLATCRGEMANEPFKVYIENEDGKVVLDQTVKSQPNGFIDLWVPRDQKLKVKISHDGKTVESKISTLERDNTCITTMRLT